MRIVASAAQDGAVGQCRTCSGVVSLVPSFVHGRGVLPPRGRTAPCPAALEQLPYVPRDGCAGALVHSAALALSVWRLRQSTRSAGSPASQQAPPHGTGIFSDTPVPGNHARGSGGVCQTSRTMRVRVGDCKCLNVHYNCNHRWIEKQ